MVLCLQKQTKESEEAQWIQIPQDLLIPNRECALAELIDTVYPNFFGNKNNSAYLTQRAIVTPLNNDVDNLNDLLLSNLDGVEHVFVSHDTCSRLSNDQSTHELLYPEEYLNSLEFNDFPSHQLKLKVGAPVILLRNLNQSNGLCNGTRLIIKSFSSSLIEAEIMTGSHVGTRCFILRITISPSNSKLHFLFKRRKFPIKLCYAMTINKSQGQTLKQVGIFLPKPIFSHGQLYMAVSRVQDRSELKILITHDDQSGSLGYGYTKNIVYKEAFSSLR